jgi:hypothetical protein
VARARNELDDDEAAEAVDADDAEYRCRCTLLDVTMLDVDVVLFCAEKLRWPSTIFRLMGDSRTGEERVLPLVAAVQIVVNVLIILCRRKQTALDSGQTDTSCKDAAQLQQMGQAR